MIGARSSNFEDGESSAFMHVNPTWIRGRGGRERGERERETERERERERDRER